MHEHPHHLLLLAEAPLVHPGDALPLEHPARGPGRHLQPAPVHREAIGLRAVANPPQVFPGGAIESGDVAVVVGGGEEVAIEDTHRHHPLAVRQRQGRHRQS